MKLLSAIILSAISLSSYGNEYEWLEKDWISDKNAVRAIFPVVDIFDEEQRETFLNWFGKMQWTFRNGILYSISNESAETHKATYEVRPLSGTPKFQIIFSEDNGDYSTYYAWRTESGFCTKLYETFHSKWGVNTWDQTEPSIYVECFKPNDS